MSGQGFLARAMGKKVLSVAPVAQRCFLFSLPFSLLPDDATPRSTTKLWKTELFVYECARSCQAESTEIACDTLQNTHPSNLTFRHAGDSGQVG